MMRATELKLREANTKLVNFTQRAKLNAHVKMWFVGASWGQHNLVDEFIKDGVWILGWNREQQPKMVDEVVTKMDVGDIIIMKKNAGPQIEVLCIGVVTNVLGEVGKKWWNDGVWSYSDEKTFMCNVHWFDMTQFKMHSYGMYSACTLWEFNSPQQLAEAKAKLDSIQADPTKLQPACDILRQLRLM